MPPPSIDWPRIVAAHPELQIQSIAFLGEGWTSHAFLVNESHVFRFPKRPEVWPELEREIAFLTVAADLLPLSVPRYTTVVRTSHAAADGYAVYERVPGRALDLLGMSRDERVAAAETVAMFLQVLHGLRTCESITRHLPHDNECAGAAALRRLAAQAVVPQLSTAEARRLMDRFDWYVDTEANFAFEPVVIHADLCADHILVDKRRVSGIIDFSDVSLGDPDYDFASLGVDVGQEFVVEVAKRYGHSDLDLLVAKLRYFEMADHVDTIVNGEGWALPGQRDTAWRRLRKCVS
jgi:aminoglycoside phosphotransferase (APT) family kinase protein